VAPLQRGFDLPSDLIRPGKIPIVYSNGIQKYHETGMATAPGLVTGRSGTIGKLHFIEHGEYWPHNTSLWVTDFKGNDPRFVYYLYGSIGMSQFSSGSGVPTLNRNDVHAFSALIPDSPDEQKKIADCLTSLDELMTAQARKVDALKTHKKGLMQQLFPREGETQSRLRFPEFQNAGECEEGKLISLSSEPLSNGVFNDPKKVGTGYKLINVSDMYIETTIDENRLSLLELLPSEFEGNNVLTGDIFFTRSSLVKSGIAVSNIYLGSSSNVTYDGHLIRFRANTSMVIPLFAHYLFKTALVRTQLIARGKTATMTTIGQADVASVSLFYPDPDEQQRIASCLSSLDDLITAETQKLETIKSHKKGLMQQLFPSLEHQS
jgi:type I restriction enzyme S subunit